MAGWCKAGSCCGCYALMLTVLLHAAVASDSCCLDEQTAIMRRKEAVKNAILSKLGMTEPPQTNITREDLTPAIMRVYQAAMKRRRRRSLEDLDEPDADTGGHHFYSRPINLLDVTGEIVEDHHDYQYVALHIDQQHVQNTLRSNLSAIHEAELTLEFAPSPVLDKDGLASHNVRVELFEKYLVEGTSAVRARFVDGVMVDLTKRKQIVLNIKAVLERWLFQPCPNKTCRLELHVHSIHLGEDGAISKFVSGIMPMQTIQSNQSGIVKARSLKDAHVLVVSHSSLPNAKRLRRRTKRQTLNLEYCRRTRNRNPAYCCLQDLELDFRKDLGWHWVHEPKSFKPNHCSGSCPYRWSSGSAYSAVIALYNNINPSASAKPCCVANDLGSVVLLFSTDSEPRVEELTMMTARTCKCR